MSSIRFTVRLAVVVLSATVPLFAQAPSSSAARRDAPVAYHGTVVDPDGRAVAGVRVDLTAEAQAVCAAALSEQDGTFTVTVPAGRYLVTLHAEGFAPASIRVTVPENSPREFHLALAAVKEDVTVTAALPENAPAIGTATKTPTPLLDLPQSITVVSQKLIRDQLMMSIADVIRYVPGMTSHQGEGNRDQVVIRGNSSSSDFFVDGIRDDVQYYRDLYNLERVEALKGPNAMIFGRGGGGGVINRVTKEASFMPVREISLLAGSFDQKRLTADFGQQLNQSVALRLNAMYEDADTFRDGVDRDRYGVNPTVTVLPGRNTRIVFGYERFHDRRIADRGITSVAGRPANVGIDTYYGNASDTYARANVDLASASVEHTAGRLTFRNKTLVGHYDRGYQNFVPGAANADLTRVTMTAYNNHTDRLNVFNQTDVTYPAMTGPVRHLLLGGAEIGRQQTNNFRNTGYFNDSATSVLVPFADPMVTAPVTFRQNATDADNHVSTRVAAVYAQDQIDLSSHVQAIAGVRVDRFDLRFHNNRTADELGRLDTLVSPRAGLVFKPVKSASLYGSYTVSFLPSSGDQFSSLTTITQQVKPERFDNYEVGAKWNPIDALAVTTAAYRLDRTNTRATDPNDPTRIVQTGSQRTNGWELGVNGTITRVWQIAGGYAYQNAFVTSATASAAAGAHAAQVPHHTLSLWNMVQVHPRLGAGIGIVHRSDMFAAIDNTVTLPRYTDVDGAVYVTLSRGTRLQVNVDNLLDRVYYVNADSNTNISPGAPRTVRVALTTGF